MLRPVIGAIDATLEELSLVLERRDWTGAQAALAELERIEQSLSQDYRHSARQRAMRASVVRALDLAQQGDLEMAFFVIDDATLEPDDVTDAVRQAMAQALEMDGELVLAAALYQRLALDAEMDRLLLKLRMHALALPERVSEIGVRLFEAAEPNDAAAATSLAIHLRTLARDEEAMDACRRALEAEPASEVAAGLLAELLAEHEQMAEAEDVLERALGALPESVDLWSALGELVEEGDSERALDCYDRALSIEPAERVALEGKRRVLTGLERWDELAAHLERCVEVLPDPEEELRRELRRVYREELRQPDKAEADERKDQRERQRAEREIDERIAEYAARKPAQPEETSGSPLWILVAVVAVLAALGLLAVLRDH